MVENLVQKEVAEVLAVELVVQEAKEEQDVQLQKQVEVEQEDQEVNVT